MSRYAPSGIAYAFGPGPMTPAVKAIIYVNVAVFFLTFFAPQFFVRLLRPRAARDLREPLGVWQLVTYLFVHDPGGFTHILFNMLACGCSASISSGAGARRRSAVLLHHRRRRGDRDGAGVAPAVRRDARHLRGTTIGASGAVYGLLLAWALIFPHRQILFMFIFPLPARTLRVHHRRDGVPVRRQRPQRRRSPRRRTSPACVIGWLYLKGPTNLRLELKYRLTKWRMDRMRRKFNVHQGGRRDKPWVH